MKCLLPGICFLCFSLFSHATEPRGDLMAYNDEKHIACDSTPARDIRYRIFANAHHYGYDIYINDRLLVHQPVVPGLPGKTGFERKKDAIRVAGLVIRKIKSGQMPPTVTKRELDSLNIKY